MAASIPEASMKGPKKHKEERKDVPQKENEIEELKEKYYRVLADLDNLRKRFAIERGEIIKFSNETLLEALLPTVDSFDRAFESFRKANMEEETLKGIALTKKLLEDTLAKAGVVEIDAQNKAFDPNYHEAVMKKKIEGRKEGDVLEVLQKGYTLHGKVLRPAMVVVSDQP